MLNIWRVGADPCVCPPQNTTYIIFSRVCQNEIMDEKMQPVVPSSWKEGLGVVEKNNDITYYKLNI